MFGGWGRRKRTLLAQAGLTIALLAGCGGANSSPSDPTSTSAGPPSQIPAGQLSKAEYERAYRAAGEETKTATQNLQSALGSAGATSTSVATALRTASDADKQFADALLAMKPPKDIAAENRGYAQVILHISMSYDTLADTAEQQGLDALAVLLKNRRVAGAMLGGKDAARQSLAFARAAAQGGYDLGFTGASSGLQGP